MALESVNAAETLIQSSADNDDLEDGEIPSDEDDEPAPPPPAPKPPPEAAKPATKPDMPKQSSSEQKFSKNKKQSSSSSGGSGNSSKPERFGKYKNPSEDWAGDVEKAIRAVLEEQDRTKSQDSSKSKSKSSRSKNRKRARDDKNEERAKEQKKRKMSDDDHGNDDDDEMLFVRGASPVSRRDGHDTTRSPPRRSTERENYDNVPDNDDKSSDRRQKDNNDSNKRGSSSSGGAARGSGRRGGKIERGGKNKGRSQTRNDRNGRRNQNADHNQDPDAICLYYMQGKCHRGDDCPFSHNALPPRKMELCKFYLMDCCAKRDKCLYMHHDFPCKFFHTGLKCTNTESCKFSHQPLNEQVKNILLKHLETAPKEILGDFPRLSRESALLMINNTVRNSVQGQESGNQKIPSLFDVTLPAPVNSTDQEEGESRGNGSPPIVVGSDQNLTVALQQKRPTSSGGKDRKPAGKKTRWGSDEDRVPYEQIMLLQSVSQLGLHLPNVALGLAVQQQLQQHILIQQCIANMEFYNEIHGSPPDAPLTKGKEKEKDEEDFTKDVGDDDTVAEIKAGNESLKATTSKDVDLREILNANRASAVISTADEAESSTTSKFDDESDRDEETDLVIEMPVDDDEMNKDEEKDKNVMTKEESVKENTDVQTKSQAQEAHKDAALKSCKSSAQTSPLTHPLNPEDQQIPPNLPKKAQELFMRIRQQQRAAKDSLAIADDQSEVEDATKNHGNWYSEDEDDDEEHNDDDDDDGYDDDEDGNLTIVIKDSQKSESDRGEKGDLETPEDEKQPVNTEISGVPQPAAFVDKLGDLSKIDISAEVTKLLSSIKPQSSKSHAQRQESSEAKIAASIKDHLRLMTKQSCVSMTDSPYNSPPNSEDLKNATQQLSIPRGTENISLNVENGNSSSGSSSSAKPAPVSRDPRMSRDPRQRRDDQKLGSPSRSEAKKESGSLRLETSIYSSGITSTDATMDTDLRARLDQDHRRKDMDLRQRYQEQDFGDTDLRVVGTNFADSPVSRSDVDLRQMLSLPFKPAPTHVPCKEIIANVSSHPPLTYKVYVVDIPRPDYTGLKLSKNDAQVKYDPRLRKIFRLPKVDIADSPMSPPPAAQAPVKPEASRSPPLVVRSDPRRKALEASNQVSQNTVGSVMPGVPPGGLAMMLGQGLAGIQQQDSMTVMGMGVQGMQASPGMSGMPQMGQNPMMGGMGPMGPMMNGPMPPTNMPPMGMGPGNGPPMATNQMAYDPRYAAQRNGGPGLLGPGPGMGYGPDVAPTSYDGPPAYQGPGNFGNFGPGPTDAGMMGFGPNGPNSGNFGGNAPPAEWSTGNQNQMRRGGRVRRRNRNRTNTGPNNRGNRSPL